MSKKEITSDFKDTIKKIMTYDSEDIRLPTVVRRACRIIVYRSLESENEVSVKLPHYTKFGEINRNMGIHKGKLCECNLCNIIRKPGHINFEQNASRSKPKEKSEKNIAKSANRN